MTVTCRAQRKQVKTGVTGVIITPKSGRSTGAITIYYNGSTTLPTEIGVYNVTFDVAEVSGWKAASGLSAGALTINDKLCASIEGLAAYLSGELANSSANPYYIALGITNTADFAALKATLDSEPTKYVYLDLSGSTVTTIPDEAFYDGCATLAGITIGNNVTSIGDYAFYRCTRLASVIIPNSVKVALNNSIG